MELVGNGRRKEWLECRKLYVMLEDVGDVNVDGVGVDVVVPGIVTIAYD